MLDEPAAIHALTHPVRLQVLDALRTADSAAGVARAIGQTRQNVNYHLKELERGGLVRRAGERRKGNLVERLYESVAGTFIVSPRVAWGAGRRVQALRDQVSLQTLVMLGEQLQQDAAHLLDRAAFDGEQIASASVQAEICFADARSREAFMADYLTALGALLKKFSVPRGQGEPFRIALAAYPEIQEEIE